MFPESASPSPCTAAVRPLMIFLQSSDHETRNSWIGPSFPLNLSSLPVWSKDIPLQYPSLGRNPVDMHYQFSLTHVLLRCFQASDIHQRYLNLPLKSGRPPVHVLRRYLKGSQRPRPLLPTRTGARFIYISLADCLLCFYIYCMYFCIRVTSVLYCR